MNDNDDQLEILMEKDCIHSIIKYSKFNYNLKVQHVNKNLNPKDEANSFQIYCNFNKNSNEYVNSKTA